MQEAMRQDKALREQYQVGDKFRFIRDRLTALMQQVEENLSEIKIEKASSIEQAAEHEMLVYVYLYNAQGLLLRTWQKMLNASVFYEYSVNRPIYLEKNAIESFIRSKPNKMQHGYLTIIVQKSDVLQSAADVALVKDVLGNVIVKVREGSLAINKLISFTHNGNDYTLGEEGELVKR
jgi:hypothetical protein